MTCAASGGTGFSSKVWTARVRIPFVSFRMFRLPTFLRDQRTSWQSTSMEGGSKHRKTLPRHKVEALGFGETMRNPVAFRRTRLVVVQKGLQMHNMHSAALKMHVRWPENLKKSFIVTHFERSKREDQRLLFFVHG